jgi:hypothetical protein
MLRLAFLFVVVLGGCQIRTRPPVNSLAVLMEALPPLGRVSARAVAQEWVPCSPSVLVVEQDRGWFRWRMDPGAGLQRPQTEPMILVLSPWVDNIPSPDLACGVLEVGAPFLLLETGLRSFGNPWKRVENVPEELRGFELHAQAFSPMLVDWTFPLAVSNVVLFTP